MGKIDVGTTEAPANVRFVNNFANTVGTSACQEALYVDTLTFEPGSTVTIDNVNVYYKTLIANGVVHGEEGCGQLLPLCFASTPPTLQTQFDPLANAGFPEPKNRAIAINAGDAGQIQSVRVTWDAMPNRPGGQFLLVGQKKWMTAPFPIC